MLTSLVFITYRKVANYGTEKDATVSYLLEDFKQFFDDSNVTEICVNAPGEVWCENKGKWVCTKVEKLTYDRLLQLGIAVAKYANTEFGENAPIVSAVLPHGERSQFVMPPACKDGTISITIRKPSFHVRTMEEYEMITSLRTLSLYLI